MTKFGERLLQAARHLGVGESQSEIAANLGLSKQTVHHWFTKGFPTVDNLALVERKWGVSGEWLRSGEGAMLPEPSGDGLTAEERELVKDYRKASPKVRDVIRTMTRAVRKSMVTIAAAIPPLLASHGDAICHNVNCGGGSLARGASVIHIACRRFLLGLLERRLVPAF